MSIWFGGVAIWTALATTKALGSLFSRPSDFEVNLLSVGFPLIGVGFFFVGAGFIRLCWYLSRGDIGYLSRIIEDALQID